MAPEHWNNRHNLNFKCNTFVHKPNGQIISFRDILPKTQFATFDLKLSIQHNCSLLHFASTNCNFYCRLNTLVMLWSQSRSYWSKRQGAHIMHSVIDFSNRPMEQKRQCFPFEASNLSLSLIAHPAKVHESGFPETIYLIAIHFHMFWCKIS